MEMESSMDAPSGQLYQLSIKPCDTIYSVRWHDPASKNVRDNRHIYVAVDINDKLISLPYANQNKISAIMRKAQELVDEVKKEPLYELELRHAAELADMLQEYRRGFPAHREELHEMLTEDELAEWRAVGPEDRELFATSKLTGENNG